MEEYCKNCGAAIRDGAKFCPDCGSEIEKAKKTRTSVKIAEANLALVPVFVANADTA